MKRSASLSIAFVLALLCAGYAARLWAQDPPAQQSPIDSSTVIRAETRVVLVDAVVTDKKGNYVHGLTQKDFRVWEDNKEQAVSSFSFQADPALQNKDRKRFIVLFFDNSNVSFADQMVARKAAKQFVAANAGPDRMMAVVEYTGALRVTQNFTDDADRLQQVVSGVKFPLGSVGGGGLSGAGSYSWNVLVALRNLVKGLSSIPERKTLVFLSGGFRLTVESTSDLAAAIDACNRANVAVYPIDVRGLVAPGVVGPRGSLEIPVSPAGLVGPAGLAVMPQILLPTVLALQKAGPGAPAPAPRPSPTAPSPTPSPRPTSPTAPSPTRGTGTTNPTNNNNNINNNLNNPLRNPNALRTIMPDLGGSQSPLYALASGTGGFVIVNTNDLLGGMEKIGKEQNEYYLLGYTPSKELEPGHCHSLRVKVEQSGDSVRYRTGYCDVKPLDVLSGTPTERDLENRLNGTATPNVSASMQAPFFYISPNTARVNVAMEIPADQIVFVKGKGGFHAAVQILGLAQIPAGGVAARFSDTVKVDLPDKKAVEAFGERPFHYEKQFEISSGAYDLKVIVGLGKDSFSKLQAPLTVDPWNTQKFSVAALALSRSILSGENVSSSMDSSVLEGRVPLMVQGKQIVPSGSAKFKKAEQGYIYTEVYEPALLAAATAPAAQEAPKPAGGDASGTDAKPAAPLDEGKNRSIFGTRLVFSDSKTGAVKLDSGLQRYDGGAQLGNPTVPIGLRLPIGQLGEGSYKLQLTVVDTLNNQFARTVEFVVEP